VRQRPARRFWLRSGGGAIVTVTIPVDYPRRPAAPLASRDDFCQ